MNVKDFFPAKEWKNLVDYEKIRLKNIYENYLQMEKLGFEPSPPDFVVAYNKRILKNKKRKPTKRQQKTRRVSKKMRLDLDKQKEASASQSNEKLDDDKHAVVPSESSETLSTTTSSELSNEKKSKGFKLEIFNIGDDSTPVTRRKRIDAGILFSAENTGFAIRTSARVVKKKNYDYDSAMEEEDDIEPRNEDENGSEDPNENPEPESLDVGLPEEG